MRPPRKALNELTSPPTPPGDRTILMTSDSKMAGDYYYVEPYHHDNTTKHGESNWSWVKLWQDVYGRPVPLCCPCKEGGEGGEKKKKRSRRKKQEGNPGTVPAIIPAFPSVVHAVGATWGKPGRVIMELFLQSCKLVLRVTEVARSLWMLIILLTGSRKNGTEPISSGSCSCTRKKEGCIGQKSTK